MVEKIINISEVKELLANGKEVFVQTLNNEFTKITKYIDKGILSTYEVFLENGLSIKTSKEHKFFTNCGWIMTIDLIIDKHKILCDDNQYYTVVKVNNIGQHRIVDITVDHPEHCYFGNKMMNHNSGKSLLAAHVMAECQKKGGIAVLFDTEGAVGMLDFYRSIGLNLKELIYVDKLRALEEVYDATERIIKELTLNDTNRPVVIVIDSINGSTTLKELEEDYLKKGYATDKAIINSLAMRKFPSLINNKNIAIILINQLRANMNAIGFGSDPYQTTGGLSIPYTASVRLRLKKLGQIKGKINDIDTAIGERIQVQIVKNRLGPPRRKITFDVRYDSGIDNYGSWLTALKELGVLSSSGSSYSYKYVNEETGEEITKKFQSKDFRKLLTENPELKQRIYDQICDAFIMKYALDEEDDLGIDDVVLDTNEFDD